MDKEGKMNISTNWKTIALLVVIFVIGRKLSDALGLSSGWACLIGFNLGMVYMYIKWRLMTSKIKEENKELQELIGDMRESYYK